MAVEVEKLVVAWEARLTEFERANAKASAGFRRQTRQIERDAQGFERRLEAAMGRAGRAGGAALTRTLGRGIAALGLGHALTQLGADAEVLVDVADRIGVTVEELQALRFAGKQANVTTAEMDKALEDFARRLSEAATGTGDLGQILAANGVALRDAEGRLRPVADLLREFAELVRNAGSAQDRVRLTTAAFGNANTELATALAGGAAGIDQATGRLREMGAVIADADARKLAALNQSFEDLGTTLGGFFKQAVVGASNELARLWGLLAPLEQRSDASLRATIDLARRNAGRLQTFDEATGGHLAERNRQRAEEAARQLLLNAIGRQDAFDPDTGTDWLRSPAPPPRATRIPGGTDDDAADRIRAVTDALKFEGEQLARTADAQELYNQLKAAGVELDSAAGREIMALVAANQAQAESIRAAEEAQERLRATMEKVGDEIADVLDRLIVQGDSLREVFGGLAKQLASSALRSGIKALFDGVAGGGGGGGGGRIGAFLGRFIGSLFGLPSLGGGLGGGGFGGFRAEGGPVSAGTAYAVGERGPELFVPTTPGRIVPRGGGPTVVQHVSYAIDASGADPEAIRRLEAALVATNRSIERRAVAAVQTAQRRFG